MHHEKVYSHNIGMIWIANSRMKTETGYVRCVCVGGGGEFIILKGKPYCNIHKTAIKGETHNQIGVVSIHAVAKFHCYSIQINVLMDLSIIYQYF